MEHIPEVPASPLRLMKERFVEIKRLGAGNFGDALLVIDKKYNAHRVVKRLHKAVTQMNPKTLAESRAEISNLSKIAHPHIVRLHRAWFDADKHLHMLMEYCEAGDLEDFVRQRFPLPEVLVRSLFMQLLVGMDEIHHNHLLHRDIKARNIFVTRAYVGHPKSADPAARAAAAEVGRHVDSRVIPHLATDSKGFAIVLKIGDFGLSKALNFTEDRAKTVAGTPFHFSPELARNQPYTRRTDIWSLGVLFYYILTLSMPFRGRTIQEVFCGILRDRVMHPAERYDELYGGFAGGGGGNNGAAASSSVRPFPYSAELVGIVMDMLNKTETQRPTTEELLGRSYFGSVPSAAAAKQRMRESAGNTTASSSSANASACSNSDDSNSATPSQPHAAVAGGTPASANQQQHSSSDGNGHHQTNRMCVARSDAIVNIRAQPSLQAPIIGTLRYLDEIDVVRHQFQSNGGNGNGGGGGACWWQISRPVAGFCVAQFEGKDLFVLKRSGVEPMRLSPLRQRGGGGGDENSSDFEDEEEEEEEELDQQCVGGDPEAGAGGGDYDDDDLEIEGHAAVVAADKERRRREREAAYVGIGGGANKKAVNGDDNDDDDDEDSAMMYSFSDAAPPPSRAVGGSGGRAAQDLRRLRNRDATARALDEMKNDKSPNGKAELFARADARAAAAAFGGLQGSPNKQQGFASPPRPTTPPPPKSTPPRSATSAAAAQLQHQQTPPAVPTRRVTSASSAPQPSAGVPIGPNNAASPRRAVAGAAAASPTAPAPPPPRKASPLAANRHGLGGVGAGHVSPIRHRKSPQVVLPPLSGCPTSMPSGGRSSPLKFFREIAAQQQQPAKRG